MSSCHNRTKWCDDITAYCDGISSQGEATLLMHLGQQTEEQSLLQLLVDITTVSADLAMHGLGWNPWHIRKADVELMGADSVW